VPAADDPVLCTSWRGASENDCLDSSEYGNFSECLFNVMRRPLQSAENPLLQGQSWFEIPFANVNDRKGSSDWRRLPPASGSRASLHSKSRCAGEDRALLAGEASAEPPLRQAKLDDLLVMLLEFVAGRIHVGGALFLRCATVGPPRVGLR
jgi:hypothetical protein